MALKMCKTEGCGEHETTEFYVHRNGLYPLCKRCYKIQASKRKFNKDKPLPRCTNCDETNPDEFHKSKYASSQPYKFTGCQHKGQIRLRNKYRYMVSG